MSTPSESEPATPATPADPALTRRHVLTAAGAVGAAGVLAACGGSANPQDAVNAAKSAASAAQSAASKVASAASEVAGKIASVSEIPVNGGVVFEQAKVVVTQPEAGQFAAYTAVCPHQGCLVSTVADNVITCPCHGSQFSSVDGSVIKGPATEGLSKAGVSVQNGDITVQ